MRGTLDLPRPEGGTYGIIPAYAGNTNFQMTMHETHGDHPRICGEHLLNDGTLFLASGSSPHMRGTPQARIVRVGRPGIIPAYAGNTSSSDSARRSAGDHPRICGEHPPRNLRHTFGTGSSPHMRGTRRCNRRTRTIPVDHPRICGEHAHERGFGDATVGSSPHMRGTPYAIDFVHEITGIIPAYAGNTEDLYLTRRQNRDHPRICGEHTKRL